MNENQGLNKYKVVVAGGNYCSNLCMAKSLHWAGYEVAILRTWEANPKWFQVLRYMKPDAYSKAVKEFHSCVYNKNEKIIVDKLIGMAIMSEKMLLIPTDDIVASVVDQYINELLPYYYLPNIEGKAGEITRLMSKDVQKKIAKREGLSVVNSCCIKTKNGKYKIPQNVNYPCMIKPNISKNGNKKRIKKINNEEELVANLNLFSANEDIEILVEDYIEIHKEYSLLGLSTKQGVYAPGLFVVNEGAHGPHVGVAVTGELLSPYIWGEYLWKIKKFVGSLNYTGLFDIDLIEDKSGDIYFIELNLRYGASGYVLTKCGANLPVKFAEEMIAENGFINEDQIIEYGKTFVSEKVLLEEYVNGYRSKEECRKLFMNADMSFLQDDEQSFRIFKKYGCVAPILRLAYSFRKIMNR